MPSCNVLSAETQCDFRGNGCPFRPIGMSVSAERASQERPFLMNFLVLLQ